MMSLKTQLQLVQEEGQSHVMGDLDCKVCKAARHLSASDHYKGSLAACYKSTGDATYDCQSPVANCTF